jgi:Arm DNA-binding domain
MLYHVHHNSFTVEKIGGTIWGYKQTYGGTMKLTDISCKTAKPKEKPYKKADGGGLYLLIKPNGARHWRLKYRYLGKEKLLAIGP